MLPRRIHYHVKLNGRTMYLDKVWMWNDLNTQCFIQKTIDNVQRELLIVPEICQDMFKATITWWYLRKPLNFTVIKITPNNPPEYIYPS